MCPDTGLVTMIQVNSLSVLVLMWSGPAGLTQLFTFYRLFAPGQPPARCSLYTLTGHDENLFDCRPPFLLLLKRPIGFFFFSVSIRLIERLKSIIFPVKSSTNNRLVRGVIREGCLVVLRILCNQKLP